MRQLSLPLTSVWRRMALNPALSSAAIISPQGGVYPWPAAAGQPTVVSSSANDAAAGTGARTIAITYLDNLYAEKTETVTINGTGDVTMVADNVLRINNINVLTVGSGGVTAGNISVKIGSDTIGYIAAGNNCIRQGVYTVPAGRRLFIDTFNTSVTHSASNKRAIIGLRRRVGGLFNSLWEIALTDGFASERLVYPLVMEEKQYFFLSGSSDGTAIVHFFVEGWQE